MSASTQMTRIPLVDLKAQHRQVAEEVAAGFAQVLEDTAFIGGPAVRAFEAAFADFLGVRFCVGVANGTDAVELALRSLGIGVGDEVIIPANTFIATAMAVVRTGARPILVDSDPMYHLMDPDQVEAALTPRCKAIIPVHLYGQIAPMTPLLRLAEAAGLKVVEDAAQSQGARQNGLGMGSFGQVAGTSFYPGKNLGAYGDAGGIVTNDEALAHRLRALRNYGSEVRYHHPEVGFNSRLDTLQAVVLKAKLSRLEQWNQQRQEAASRYNAMLAVVGDLISLPQVMPGNEHIYHLYVVRVPQRDETLRRLATAGIDAGIHYPVPIHLQGAFKSLGYERGAFPVAEKAGSEILSLPIFAEITEEQQARVVDELIKAVRPR